MLKKSWLYKFGIVVLLLLIRALLCNVPTAYAESGEEDAVSSISEIDKEKEETETMTRMIYAPNTTASNKIDVYLGVTKDVVSWLKSHEKDDYYLGTKYIGTIENPSDCIKPKGEYGSDSGMNCTGFVASVLKKNGGNLDKITQRLSGSYANACNWQDAVHKKDCRSYRFTSIKDMLASGKLEKGDLIYFEPDWQDEDDDCHIGFFWGNTSSENKFWHSTEDLGNIISEIKPKTDYVYVYIFKTQKRGSLQIVKTSANESVTKNHSNYTLSGAVYQLSNDAGDVVAELTTDANGVARVENIPVGTYFLKEIKAPQGYKVDEKIYNITIKNGETVVQNLKDEPIMYRINACLLRKLDKDTNQNLAQGAATLANAEFTIKYYDGIHTSKELEGKQPKKTWILKTDEKGECKLEEGYKVSGDSFYYDQNGRIAIPKGTLVICETKAPKGYLLNEEVFVRHLENTEKADEVVAFQTINVPERIIKGNFKIKKYGADSEKIQKKYPLEGVVFLVKSKTTGKELKLVTDENGEASTEALGGLVYDTYEVREISAPENYIQSSEVFEVKVEENQKLLFCEKINYEKKFSVQIIKRDAESKKIIAEPGVKFRILDANKQILFDNIETDKSGIAQLPERLAMGQYYVEEIKAPSGYLLGKSMKFTIDKNADLEEMICVDIYNQPIKGKITLQKVDSEDKTPLCGVRFHIIAAENILTKDGRLHAKEGDVVDQILTDEQGKACSKELYLGMYYVVEAETIKGYVLNSDKIKVNLNTEKSDAMLIMKDLGQIENVKEPKPKIIGTTLVDDKKEHVGLYASEVMRLYDTVQCTDLKKGETYTVEGVLMDYETGKPVTINGKNVTSSITFVADEMIKKVIVKYVFDASSLEGKKIVAYETLKNSDGVTWEHNDLEDEQQTVYFSKIRTNAYDDKTKEKTGFFESDTLLKDEVYYHNLIPGKLYVIKGILVSKRTGKPVIVDGEKVTAEKWFVANEKEGTVLVEFMFGGTVLEEQEVVVYEYLYFDEELIAKHEDIHDENQTVLYMKKENPKREKNPLTGDNRYLMIFILCATLSCVTLIKCVRMSHRK